MIIDHRNSIRLNNNLIWSCNMLLISRLFQLNSARAGIETAILYHKETINVCVPLTLMSHKQISVSIWIILGRKALEQMYFKLIFECVSIFWCVYLQCFSCVWRLIDWLISILGKRNWHWKTLMLSQVSKWKHNARLALMWT